MKPTMTSSEPESRSTAYARLQAQGEAEAEWQQGRNRRDYIAELDRLLFVSVEQQALGAGAPIPAPVPLLDALDAELAALKAAEKLRPRFEAMLSKYRAPTAHDPKRLADEVRGFRGTAQGALGTLDNNPGQIENWQQKIAAVEPDCGSPTTLAAAHFGEIRPLLDRARSLPDTVADLDRMARQIDLLVAELLARRAPVEITTGAGPLLTETTAPARSKTVDLVHGRELFRD